MDTFGDRINKILEVRGIKQAALAEIAGVSRSAVNFWTRGKLVKGEKVAFMAGLRICNALRINPNWLMFGENGMEAPDPEDPDWDKLEDSLGALLDGLDEYDKTMDYHGMITIIRELYKEP